MILLKGSEEVNFKSYYLNNEWAAYDKAELLWLWYDYYTEIYDRGLWSQHTSEYDDTLVVLTDPEAIKMSNQNAQRVKKYIYDIARSYNISDKIMFDMKNDNYRMVTKMQKRIDDFIEFDNKGEFKFIYELVNEK
jgi:hypothetical protein